MHPDDSDVRVPDNLHWRVPRRDVRFTRVSVSKVQWSGFGLMVEWDVNG